MGGRFRKLGHLYRSLGPRPLLARALRRMVATVYAKQTELLIVKRLDGGPPSLHRPNELRMRAVTTDDVAVLKAFNEAQRTRRKVLASTCYVRNGYQGFLAFVEKELIGYWWWVGNTLDPAITHPCVERFGLRLGDDEVFAFDYFIAPGYRAKGAAVKFLSLIYAELARRGYGGVWGSVDAANAPARWVYNALGNKVVRRTVAYELFSSFLFQGERIFVRNTRWNATHSFDRRLLWPLRATTGERRAADSGGASLWTHGV
jgi:GNAT superfamily N-acetyltransferase